MLMLFAVTGNAKRDSVRDFIAKFNVGCERPEMVRMKRDGFTSALIVMIAALLASVVVALEHSLAPVSIFNAASGDVVLVGFVGAVVGLLSCAYLVSMLSCVLTPKVSAAIPAEMTKRSLLSVFKHHARALWTPSLNSGTRGTDEAFVLAREPLPAYTALDAYPSRWSRAPRVARNTVINPPLTSQGEGRDKRTTIQTRNLTSFMARSANAVLSRVVAAYPASILHIANIPQLTGVRA